MTTCPNCGSERVVRLIARVPGGEVGYDFCLDCWWRYDGVPSVPGLQMPIGVIARVEEGKTDGD